MRGSYRAKIFVATAAVAAAATLLASAMAAVSVRRQTRDRIERGLVGEARLAADLLSHGQAAATPASLQAESKALARHVEARVTLIASDGRVVGDSSQDVSTLPVLENHADRPEVVGARRQGVGAATRFSATLGVDMLYVAVPVRHPSIAVVRLALPLTEVNQQLAAIWRATLYALALSVLGAFGMAWLASAVLVRRLSRLAAGARQYAAGAAAAPPPDHEADEVGTVARVLGQTVRQLGERAADLDRARARLEAILAGMVEGVVVVDGGNRVQLVNTAARRLLRIDGDVAGRHVLECVRHPAVVSQLTRATSREPAGLEDPPVVQAGGRVFVARATPIDGPPSAKPSSEGGAVLVLHDITDLHRADQVRRDFVANVSHELRTPLTAIRGYVEALADDLADPGERRRFLEIIMRHTSRMERLARDLLRLARLEARQDRLEYGRCRISEIVRGVAADLRPRLDDKQQRVEVSVDAEADELTTDHQQLQDALRNLVENAALYSPPKTTITVSGRRTDGRVAIAVADEGPGIPPADLGRIFERFYRVDKARSSESGGTGLGLAIVKHIIERMEGSVRAENRPGGGAVFTVELPVNPSRA